MIQNKSMSRAAKKRWATYYFDINATAEQKTVIYDPENPIKLHRADMCYVVATAASATPTEGVRIGNASDGEAYMADMIPAVSQSAGTVTAGTLVTTFVPAGTPIIICRDALSGVANTGEVTVTLWYEVLDRSPKK